jgi:uncharacterized membrane protein
MEGKEIIDLLLGILGVGILGMISFTVKYLKEIATNLNELNKNFAVMISRHDDLERRVEDLEDKI